MAKRRITKSELSWVLRREASELSQMKAGASLELRTGYTIPEILAKATSTRLDLSRHFLNAAQDSVKTPSQSRSTVSRCYYSMYHALRAMVFYVNQGDDYEKHSVLQTKLPNDFPDVDFWKNELKNARLVRNRADYDPCLPDPAKLQLDAQSIVATATKLLPVVRTYLRSRGCSL